MRLKSLMGLVVGVAMAISTALAYAGIVTLRPKITGFNQVVLQNSGELILRQGAQDSIVMKVPAKLKNYMNVYKAGNVLNMGIKDHPFRIWHHPVYLVTMKHITGIAIGNSGQIEVKTPIHTNSLAITLKNSGQINIPNVQVNGPASVILHNSGRIHIGQLQAQNISLYLANSGHININNIRSSQLSGSIRNSGEINLAAGQAHQENVSMKNSGQYLAKNVVAQNASVVMHNSGRVAVHVVKNISIRKRGAGQLFVYGHPRINHLDVHNASGMHMVG